MELQTQFDYGVAFSRNLGLLSTLEQKKLKTFKVAIAGLGGVGGGHALCLARMGISRFHIADFDKFELANFNRQMGANISTIGLGKATSLEKQLLDINPQSEIGTFPMGITSENLNDFLSDVDLIIDGIDFFKINIRKEMYRVASEKNIPILLSAPLGYSSTLISFHPKGMSFEDYFQIYKETPYFDALVNFIIGIAPKGLHWSYFHVRPEDVLNKRGPSISFACFMCSSLIAMEVLVYLTDKRKPICAPHSVQVDLLKKVYKKVSLPFGNASLVQRLKRYLLSKKFEPYRTQIEAMGIKN